MKVKELIAILKKTDPNREVILSSDSEGNCYSTVHGISESAYRAKDGEIGLEKLTAEDKREGYTEEDVIKDGKPAIVLYPLI